jgi:hypothetical protein
VQTTEVQQELLSYNEAIQHKIGDNHLTDSDLSFEIGSEELMKALNDVDDNGVYEPYEPEADRPEMDLYDEETLDHMLAAEVVLPKGDYQFVGKVIGRKRDVNGNPVGRASNNPILDTRVYEVEFPDGSVSEYVANKQAEAIVSNETGSRNPTQKFTTKGWTLQCH